MTAQRTSEQREDITKLVPADPQNLAPGERPESPAGPRLSDEESQEIQVRARELVKQLEGASGSEELELIDSMTNLGMQAQRRAGGEMELLRGRVGHMITNDSPGNELSKDLVELRAALNQINPHELSNQGLVRRLLQLVPFTKPLSPGMRILERIAIRYEPVSKQVSMIETRLRDGRAMLTRDNVEMRKLYEQVEFQQLPIQRNAYLGELVMAQLEDLLERTEDTLRAERIRNSLHDVSMRVQDLRAMDAVHAHFSSASTCPGKTTHGWANQWCEP